MKRTITLFTLLVSLSTACSQEKTLTEKFCDCFTSQAQLSFGERTGNCNPFGQGQQMNLQLTLNAIDSCDSFFQEVLTLQLVQVKSRANEDLTELIQLDSLSQEQELTIKMNRAIINSDFELLLSVSTQLKDLYPQNTDYGFLKAFAHEQLGQLNQAADEYKHLNTLTQSDRYNLGIAIVERRKKK